MRNATPWYLVFNCTDYGMKRNVTHKCFRPKLRLRHKAAAVKRPNLAISAVV